MKRGWIAALPLALAACGGGSENAGGGDEQAVREAAQAYSDAFLTGDSEAAYALLSDRCQDRMSSAEFAGIVKAAAEQFGDALEFKTFDAEMNDDQARVTYTYDMSAINQTEEPWVNEDGRWREDDC